MNANERRKTLNNNGIDTSKYFNIKLPNGLKPGSDISIRISENGTPVIIDNYDIRNDIIKNGYVKNTKLYRRFVMAQMFRMLNYNNNFYNLHGYTDCLNNCYGYNYTISMMGNEIHSLANLEHKDKESFEERKRFFNKSVITNTLMDYYNDLKKYIDSLKVRKCKGVPYKRIHGYDIFMEDINKKIFKPILCAFHRINNCSSYTELDYDYSKFVKNNYVKLPENTKKSKYWVDAFKGSGAFYTMKNLIMYHDCHVVDDEAYEILFTDEALKYINEKADEYTNQGWRLFGLMKEMIDYNDFDFNKRMEEIYSE